MALVQEQPIPTQPGIEPDASFLDEDAGAGFEDLGMEQQAIPLLLICQSNSSDAVEAGVIPGEFYNNITKKSYGNSINLIAAYFKVAWLEWIPNGGGFAGRYEPGSIEVTGNVYDGMKNPKTGNTVVETWLYYVMLYDHPGEGFFVFSSTPGNMKYLKAWNTQMKFLRLPSGKPAQIYSSVWQLTTGKDQNKAGQKYYSLRAEGGKPGIVRVGWITKELKTEYVEPIRIAAPKARLQISQRPSESADDAAPVNEEY
jgi:hypothetical protein